MAFAEDHLELRVGFRDNGNQKTTRTYRYVDGTTYAEAAAGVAAAIATIVALTDDLVSDYAIQVVSVNDVTTLPAAGVQNENQLIITAGIVDQPLESGTLTMPAPKIGAFVDTTGPNANIMDTTESIVTNFVGLFADGGQFTFSDNELLNISILKGKRRHTKNSNG